MVFIRKEKQFDFLIKIQLLPNECRNKFLLKAKKTDIKCKLQKDYKALVNITSPRN